MNAVLQRIREQLGRLNERLSRSQKLAIGALGLLLIAAVGFLFWRLSRPEFRTLYTELTDAEAGTIVSKLQERKVPFRLLDGGTTIQVPAEQVGELRVMLAAEGGPTGTLAGYRLIDQSDMFGMPDEIIRLNKKRILEGELAQSIEALEEVRKARVHLAEPPETLFVEDQRPPTASVVVTLEPGATLSKRQVRGIVNLVSGAVPRLEPEGVSVVDQHGKVLSRPRDALADGSTALEYQRALEAELERKATEVLERFVGPGKAMVRVRAKLDFSREERTEELYDPEKQVVRSEEILNETRESGADQVGGAAGAAANAPNVAQGVVRVGDASSSAREKTVTNYEINKVTKRVREPGAEIERLSIAVIVDGNYKTPEGAAAGAEGEGAAAAEAAYEPRTPEEMETIRRLVANALEFNPDRGDQIEVANVRFHQESTEAAEAALSALERERLIGMAVRYGLILLVALLLIFLVFRPLVRWLVAPPESAEVLAEGELPPEEQLALPGEEALAAIEEQESKLIDQIRDYVREHPDLAAQVVRYWLKTTQQQPQQS